ncbi:hypothetical protein SAY87_020698 [Trapa incisa]|uniref:Uncharacterized protein n=1 Tax=Trapa incisa TaxID=236973 RepID=A0AAN7JQQ5_9MYRT|nr:hypothetical protein SAY87_020698 [Trapa incisa]
MAHNDKNFNPSEIDDLMRLFEIEAYRSWAAAELEALEEELEADAALEETEATLDSAMEMAMEEFQRFEEDADRISKEEYNKLVETGERARTMGNLMEKTASVASKKYVEAAINSATASTRAAVKGFPTSLVLQALISPIARTGSASETVKSWPNWSFRECYVVGARWKILSSDAL